MRGTKLFFLVCLTVNWGIIGYHFIYGADNTSKTGTNSPEITHQEVLENWFTPVSSDEDATEERPSEKRESTDAPLNLTPPLAEEPIFTSDPLSQSLIYEMEQLVSLDIEVIQYDQLRLLTVTHVGFDGKSYYGQLLVHSAVVDDLLAIFEEMYQIQYPIEKMILISAYRNDDTTSMSDNNTSAFNFRTQTENDSLSHHAYGLAIDINPKMNPYVNGETISPENGTIYVNRDTIMLGMIHHDDPLYQAFISRGWEWGGDWNGVKDYQHFSKRID